MAKLTLAKPTSGYNLSAINDNFTKIEAEFQDKVLYRDNPVGENNVLQNNLDVNSFDLINIGNLKINGDLTIAGVNFATVVAETKVNADNAAASEAGAGADAISAAASAADAAASALGVTTEVADAIAALVPATIVRKTSDTGALIGPAGTTAQRPGSPVVGYTRFNTTLNIPEVWNNLAWVPMGGGATGGGTDALGVENDTFIGTPYTIGSAAIQPCTISIASPCVITQANTYLKDQTVRFTSTGALPTGLSADGVYFIITAGLTTSSFQVSLTQGGAAVNTSGTQSGAQGVGKTKNMNVAGGITIGDAGGITIPTGCGIVIGG
jgi:hypothetical protein